MALKKLSPTAQKQIPIKATYSSAVKHTSGEGRNAPPPKVTNVGNNKTVKAKPQTGVSVRKN